MAQIETQGILQDIETLVSDHLQVVSYKWLSRNYLVSSNEAKRLLQEFVENHGGGFGVVYTLSGRLKNTPESYHVRLVSEPRLAEAKEDFDGNYSIGVYSVQPCIPKDPATMWNTEFVQAEELHKQAPTVENCLRDNRFGSIPNSFVLRNVGGTPVTTAGPQPKTKLAAEPLKSNSSCQDITSPKQQQNKGELLSPKLSLQAPNVVKDVKIESNDIGVTHQPTKPPADKGKVAPLPANKEKVQNDKSSYASGGSLANLWGRASVKPKSDSAAENNNLDPTCTGASAGDQISARESVPGVISDDEDQDVNFKRASGSQVSRKRRAVFDFSDDDECEDAINLASPGDPKERSCQEHEESSKTLVPHKITLNFDEQVEDKPEVKEETLYDGESNPPCREDSMVISKERSSGISLTEKTDKSVPPKDVNKLDKLAIAAKAQRDAGIIPTEKKHNSIPENDVNKIIKSESGVPGKHVNNMDKLTNAASRSPQRTKILKMHIDERGREVTEVIWEGKESEAKKADISTTKKTDISTTKKNDNTVSSVTNRPPAAQKSAANTGVISQTAKGKKVVNKDPKQGNILSFFKKV